MFAVQKAYIILYILYVRHIKIHQGEEREKFVCPNCGKILLQKESFKKHMDSKHNGKSIPATFVTFKLKVKTLGSIT